MPFTPPLNWDIFCHVIDNWGDLGVCWRLATNLAARGQRVRLWTDQPEPLDWMAPGARSGALASADAADAAAGALAGIEVRHWPRSDPTAPPPALPASDVLIAAFGCELAPAWVAALQPEAAAGAPRRLWLNLEYLSAEAYVERCHRLASPVMSGPLAGRTEWFFYPGFTPATGGLLREPGLMAQRAAFERGAWLRGQGLPDQGNEPRVTLFCYEPARLPELLRDPALRAAHWLVAPGRPTAALELAWPAAAGLQAQRHALPHVAQTEFDRLLWASDLNLVRGEDSLVRALWAGQAFIWHIYPQHDDAHHLKLEAFLDWLDAPASLRAFHRVWNGVVDAPLPPIDLAAWQACALAARDRLLHQDDLASQLLGFVAEKR
jgi:uncharacterized repeat protein (TIGR03837 family)